MWKVKDLKKSARSSLKHNYWRSVGVCLLVLFFMGGLTFRTIHSSISAVIPQARQTAENDYSVDRFGKDALYEIIDNFSHRITPAVHPTRGALAVFFNDIVSADSFSVGILEALNQIIFQGRLGAGIIMLAGFLMLIFFKIFISNPITVGRARFFEETRTYYNTSAWRIFYPFRTGRYRRTVFTMFIRDIRLFLWSLTIIGGAVKYYTYMMVPYIAAENPRMKPNDVIALSRTMMKGHKRHAFLLDLSFSLWALAGILTLSFLNVLYFSPYICAAHTELYMHLRKNVKDLSLPLSEGLCDSLLSAAPSRCAYPANSPRGRKRLAIDYNRHYSLCSLILLFFSFSVLGWLWEVGLHFVNYGVFVNRGVLLGPWLPIYGTGGVLLIIALQKFRSKPVLVFLLAMVLCGIVEYCTAWALDAIYHMKWWDYSGYLLNLQGRICLEGLIVFGLGGCGFIYVLGPVLDELFLKIPKKITVIICIALITLFAADLAFSAIKPNAGKGITDKTACAVSERTIL